MSARFIPVALVVLLAACAEPGPVDTLNDCRGACRPDEPLFALATMAFASGDDSGKVDGFDLDASDGPARQDCIAEDFVAPDGRVGIDNQFARLLPLLLAAIGEALPTLVQKAIDEGGVALMMQLVPADASHGPALAFYKGTGTPLLAADGHLLPGQTYHVNDDAPLAICRDAKVDGRRIECAGFELPLAIVVFGIQYELIFRESKIVIELDEAGENADVLVGGAIKLDDVYDLIDSIENGPKNLSSTVHSILPGIADMIGPDTDTCDRFSAAAHMTLRVGWAMPK